MNIPIPTQFADRLTRWQRIHGRHHLPWQTNDPYCVWLSEIMLQQTQVTTVIPYYQRFIEHYPTVTALAQAPQDQIMQHWAGLGYYARARNLHHAAQQITQQYDGKFPTTRAELETLKGIGRTTAAAICVFAYGQKQAIFDGNVKRVLARHRAITGDIDPNKRPELWTLAEALLPNTSTDCKTYTQGLMDLGSILCTRSKPNCPQCPVNTDCLAYQQNTPTAYPEKKPPKTKPQKTGHFLLLTTPNGDIYLEQRPTKGIWGGLWSLPWFTSLTELENYCTTHNILLLPQHPHHLTHQFTHYTLQLHTYHATTHEIPPNLTGKFMPKNQSTLGLPTPITTIINAHQTSPQHQTSKNAPHHTIRHRSNKKPLN